MNVIQLRQIICIHNIIDKATIINKKKNSFMKKAHLKEVICYATKFTCSRSTNIKVTKNINEFLGLFSKRLKIPTLEYCLKLIYPRVWDHQWHPWCY